MKVDTSRLKKGTSEVPPECQNLIDKLKACNRTELIEELSKIETWTFGKCELFHWIDILDIFDEILEEATHYKDNQIYISCDTPQFEEVSKLKFDPLRAIYKCIVKVTSSLCSFSRNVLYCNYIFVILISFPFLGSKAPSSCVEFHNTPHRAQFLSTSLQLSRTSDTALVINRFRNYTRCSKPTLHVLEEEQLHFTIE